MTKHLKGFFAAGTMILAALVISGCSIFKSAELNPAQQAYLLNEEYQAAADAALACKAIAKCWDIAGDKIKVADAVAFSYVEKTTLAAKKWVAAQSEDESPPEVEAPLTDVASSGKGAETAVFSSLYEKAKAAVAKLAGLLG